MMTHNCMYISGILILKILNRKNIRRMIENEKVNTL